MMIVPIVVGPTGVGKTEIVISAIEDLDTEIISADSQQIYRHMDIGTAKPTREQRGRVPHSLVDCIDIDESFNAARYGRMARKIISALLQKGTLPVVVGGSGLYIRALREGFFEGPGADARIRKKLIEQEKKNGSGTLYRLLSQADPEIAGRIHPHDQVRIIRALEVFQRTGVPLSQWQHSGSYSNPGFSSSVIGLYRPRADLYRRIEARVDHMMEEGLLEEVRGLLQSGNSSRLPSLSTLGYKEISEHLEGRYDLDSSIDRLKQNTRQYAKRQMTWFLKQQDILWYRADQDDDQLRQTILNLRMGRKPVDEEISKRRVLMRKSWVQGKTSAGKR